MWLTNAGRLLCRAFERKHELFIGKTLLVEENDVATAMGRMNRLLSEDGVIQSIRYTLVMRILPVRECERVGALARARERDKVKDKG